MLFDINLEVTGTEILPVALLPVRLTGVPQEHDAIWLEEE